MNCNRRKFIALSSALITASLASSAMALANTFPEINYNSVLQNYETACFWSKVYNEYSGGPDALASALKYGRESLRQALELAPEFDINNHEDYYAVLDMSKRLWREKDIKSMDEKLLANEVPIPVLPIAVAHGLIYKMRIVGTPEHLRFRERYEKIVINS